MGHCRSPHLASSTQHATCFQNGGCLFDLSVDESETNDLFTDPTMAGVVRALTARLAEAGASGPPWAHPASAYTKEALEPLAEELCAYESKVGYTEPTQTNYPPLPPPSPPAPPSPPSPPPVWTKCIKAMKAHCPYAKPCDNAACVACGTKHCDRPVTVTKYCDRCE